METVFVFCVVHVCEMEAPLIYVSIYALVTKTIWLQKHIEREVTKIKRESRPPRVTKTDGVWEDWLVTKAVTKSPASVSSITITRIGRETTLTHKGR